jgi:paraquat-inducible protein A
MLLPIISVERLGYRSASTIWEGVTELWKSGSPTVSVIVFLCSIVIPLGKILGLFYVSFCWNSECPKRRFTLLSIIEGIGRWSMLDVFLVAILVATVKLGSIATVIPGPGIVAFTAVVLLTMFASASFDPHLFWHSRDTTQ